MWRESYEDEKFIENVDKMWSQVEPLYNELHTYVKRKLEKLYGDKMDKKSDLIPAHLLGNMWAQSWVNLYDRTKPYDDGSLIDVTDKLKENWSVIQMFEESDRFYKDLGLEPNDMEPLFISQLIVSSLATLPLGTSVTKLISESKCAQTSTKKILLR
jgi:peptidyl-dipeptidase A